MDDQVKVQVRFTITEGEPGQEGYLEFTDALYYDIDDYNALTDIQIEQAKQARFDAWKVARSTPTEPTPLTDEEIQFKLEQIQSQRDFLQTEEEGLLAELGG